MKKVFKIFFLFVFAGVFLQVLNLTAFAASSYTVTESTATVGTATNLEIEYTVDTSEQTWADADTLTITLPSNFPAWGTFTAEYDTDTDNDATGETAITSGVGNGQYSVVGNTLTIKWDATTWGAPVDGASTIRVLVTGGAIPLWEDATSTITFGGTTAAVDTDPSGSDTINVSAADAAASLTLAANSVVGTAGNTTLALTLPIAIDNLDTIAFDAPANLDVSGVAFASETFAGAGTISGCAPSGQTVTCTANGPITAGGGTIVMSGITSKYVASSQTITSVAVTDTGNGTVASDSSGAVTDTTAADPQAAIDVSNISTVGNTGTVTYTFTNPVALVAGDYIDITFPANYNISGADTSANAVTSNFTGTPTFTASLPGGQVLRLTADGGVPAEATKSLVIPAGIVAGYPASASTITSTVYDNSASANIATASDTIAATTGTSSLSCSITVQSPVAGIVSPHIVSCTTSVQIPLSGKIEITYPSGWDVSGVSGQVAHTLTGMTGTWTASVSGQVVTLTQSGGSATSAGSIEFTIDNAVNPSTVGSGGTASIITKNSSSATLEGQTGISLGDVIAGSSSIDSSSDTETTTTTDTETETGTDSGEEESSDTTTESEEGDTATEETDGDTGGTDESGETDSENAEALGEATVQSGGGFNDVADDHWGRNQIEVLAENNIINGDPDGSFRPDDNLNRAEAAAVLFRVLGDLEEPGTPAEMPFNDVAVDAWYTGYINGLKIMKLVNGNPDGSYEPGEMINRAEFLKLAMNVYYYLADEETKAELDVMMEGEMTDNFVDVEAEAWYANTVYAAKMLGFVNGKACGENMCFEPANEISRAEAVSILYNMFFGE